MTSPSPWREPSAETHDFPGLCVSDARVSGSITDGCTRLPLWAFSSTAIAHGWEQVEKGWEPTITQEQFSEFVYWLLEQRGEFGRLLCVLADVERRESVRGASRRAWWQKKGDRKRVADQLRACLAALGEDA